MTNFRVEAGLPAYGPPALSFPEPDAFSEGFVVSFTTISGERWTGNFAAGPGGVTTVRDGLGPQSVIVVSRGAAYFVDIEAREASEIAWAVSHVEYVASWSLIVIGNGLWFEAIDASGPRWRTRRISWDDMRAIRHDSDCIVGEAFTPMGPPDWVPFKVDLASGEVEGGSYNGPP